MAEAIELPCSECGLTNCPNRNAEDLIRCAFYGWVHPHYMDSTRLIIEIPSGDGTPRDLKAYAIQAILGDRFEIEG